MPPDLRQLRYFLAVAEERHFGRAALRLHMTQPPLSQAIQHLEAQLGVELFRRSTRHIELSAAGQALLPEAQRLLAQAEQIPHLVLRAAKGETGVLRIAFISIADYSVLPPSLSRFRQQFPDVQFQLQEATSDVQWGLLERGEIDLGFLIPPMPLALESQLDYQRLRLEPLLLAIPESAAGRPRPTQLASYQDLALILFPRKIAPALHDTILGYFHRQGLTPVIAQEAIQMQTIVALVSANLGMSLVPASVSNLQRPGVRYLPLAQAGAPVEIGVAWRREHASPVLSAFLETLKTLETVSPC